FFTLFPYSTLFRSYETHYYFILYSNNCYAFVIYFFSPNGYFHGQNDKNYIVHLFIRVSGSLFLYITLCTTCFPVCFSLYIRILCIFSSFHSLPFYFSFVLFFIFFLFFFFCVCFFIVFFM